MTNTSRLRSRIHAWKQKSQVARHGPLFDRHNRGFAADLSLIARTAEEQLQWQSNRALLEVYSEQELSHLRDIAERIRKTEWEQKLADAKAAEEDATQTRRTDAAIRRLERRDRLRSKRALADLRRSASPTAQLSGLYIGKWMTSTAFAIALVIAMGWSAVNVQQQMVPSGSMADPLYWFSYGIEALISVQLVAIMIAESKVARWSTGRRKGRLIAAELALLAGSLALNSGSFLVDGEFVEAGKHAVAPLMVGSILLVHSAVSEMYGDAIKKAAAELPAAALEEAVSAPPGAATDRDRPEIANESARQPDRDRITSEIERPASARADRDLAVSGGGDREAEPGASWQASQLAGERGEVSSSGFGDNDPIAIGSQAQAPGSGSASLLGQSDEPGVPANTMQMMAPIAADKFMSADRAPITAEETDSPPPAEGPVFGGPGAEGSTAVRTEEGSGLVVTFGRPRSSAGRALQREPAGQHDEPAAAALKSVGETSAGQTDELMTVVVPRRIPRSQDAWFDAPLDDDEVVAIARELVDSGRSKQTFDDLVTMISAANEPNPELPTTIAKSMRIAHSTALRALKAARQLHRERHPQLTVTRPA